MNALAEEVLAPQRWPISTWALRAWRRMNWRHIVLTLVIELVRDAINPLGGIFFPPVDLPGWDPIEVLLAGSWVVTNLVIIYCVLVADEAFDDGVPPLRAYGAVVAVLALILPSLNRLYYAITGGRGHFAGEDEGTAQLLWWSLVVLYEGGFGLSIYAYWRVTQKAMRRAQAAETERVRNEQRVQTARLLALQSRVEPQLLFDALGRVGELHDGAPGAADELLADMIALLRSMQPGAGVDTSTVEREFGLVQAWLRVMRNARREAAHVRQQAAPGAKQVGIAPMLVLPLIRAVLASPHAAKYEWRLSAAVSAGRLVVTLGADDPDARALLEEADLDALRERLARLFGQSAHLTVSDQRPSVTLDLPRLLEDTDDQRVDR